MQKQQGDVNLELVNEMPAGVTEVKPTLRGLVIAEGEHTGHAHRFSDIKGLQVFEKDGNRYIKTSQPAVLRHEEHKPITLEPGIWKSWIVKEYDHFAEEAKNVAD